MRRTAAESPGFTPLPNGSGKVRQELALTGGSKAWAIIMTIIIIIGAAAAVATLVLVAIRFAQNCCGSIKHDIDEIEDHVRHVIRFLSNCVPVGDDGCSSNSDCCPQFGTTVACNNGTCEALVM